jgi:hypothetical protein
MKAASIHVNSPHSEGIINAVLKMCAGSIPFMTTSMIGTMNESV